MPRETYTNSNWEQISIRCPNCMSENIEFEEYDGERDMGTYFCLDCKDLFTFDKSE